MNATLAVARRELGALFGSPIVLMVAGAFHLWNGLVYRSLVVGYVESSRDATGSGALPPLEIADAVLAPLGLSVAFGLLLFLPLLTMRAVADERRSGFEDLLLSLPATPTAMILGKFLALLVVVGVLAWPPLLLSLGLSDAGVLDYGVLASAAVGLLLAGAAYAAVGLCASTLTPHPVAAGVAGLTVLLVLFFAERFWAPAGLLSLRQAFDPFSRGVPGLRAAGWHVLAAALFLFVAVHSAELRRRTR